MASANASTPSRIRLPQAFEQSAADRQSHCCLSFGGGCRLPDSLIWQRQGPRRYPVPGSWEFREFGLDIDALKTSLCSSSDSSRQTRRGSSGLCRSSVVPGPMSRSLVALTTLLDFKTPSSRTPTCAAISFFRVTAQRVGPRHRMRQSQSAPPFPWSRQIQHHPNQTPFTFLTTEDNATG